MKKFQCNYAGFVNPAWLNSLSGRYEAQVKDGAIYVNNAKLHINGEVKNGTKMIFFSHSFNAVIKSDLEAHEAEMQARREKKEEEALRQGIERMNTANNFHTTLNAPFSYYVGVKEVLSGLREGSNGCGTKRNTVFHVILAEDFCAGRFKRNKGNFLCTAPSARGGGNWSGQNDEPYFTYLDRKTKYMPKVTCKSCLSRLRKLGLKVL